MDPLDLGAIAARVSRPDGGARVAARERLDALASPAGALGRLGDLAGWLAGVQGGQDVRPIRRPRLLVVAADHGVAAAGVSAQPPGATTRSVHALLAGVGPVATTARVTGTPLRVVDAAVDADDLPAEVIPTGVRRGSGRIDREDGLSRAEAERAFSAGMRLADAEADEGTDLLLVASVGRAATTPAAALVAALTGGDAASVVGRGSGIDDRTWMSKCAAVRDALRRARPVAEDPLALVATAGGADLALLGGLLVQAAARRTPVVLDGLVPAAAGLLAHRIAYAAADWWLAAQRSPEPACDRALAHLALEPLLDLGLLTADGVGAALTVPVIRAAAALLAEQPCWTD